MYDYGAIALCIGAGVMIGGSHVNIRRSCRNRVPIIFHLLYLDEPRYYLGTCDASHSVRGFLCRLRTLGRSEGSILNPVSLLLDFCGVRPMT